MRRDIDAKRNLAHVSLGPDLSRVEQRRQSAVVFRGKPMIPNFYPVLDFGLGETADMLRDTAAALSPRGMKKHRRRAPGQITVESFW